MVARNGDKFADVLRESEGWGQVSVRLADGMVVNVPGVRMDLAVKFEDFDSAESSLVLDMDKYDLILGMPWLVKRETRVDWCAKVIGARRPAVSDRALVSNVPTSVRDWGARDGRQGAYAPEEVLGVTDTNKCVAVSLATGHGTKAHCQAFLDDTDQAGNIGPQAAETVEESTKGVSSVGNIGPQGQENQYEDGGVIEHLPCDNQAPHSESETPPLEALPEVSALLNLEELSMKDFLAELKAGEIAAMVILKPF
ncbi:Gag protein [Phytophthora palmivora]|uniref:Gag protein n=1 Tax=Phytophthora palmivora TaxID=4796 RepID=A0A2P4YR66_9STRA|nr:Gag protein [Phytophthora palmivora]